MAEAATLRTHGEQQRRRQAEVQIHQLQMDAEREHTKNSVMRTEAIISVSEAQKFAQTQVDEVLKQAEQRHAAFGREW